jgi:hypothetical protein
LNEELVEHRQARIVVQSGLPYESITPGYQKNIIVICGLVTTESQFPFTIPQSERLVFITSL